MSKQSIRFYKDYEVRAIWDEENSKWWFSVLDIVGAINEQDDYQKNCNYWKYLKTKLKKEQSEVVSATNQLRLTAPDGKKRMTLMWLTQRELHFFFIFSFFNSRAQRRAYIYYIFYIIYYIYK